VIASHGWEEAITAKKTRLEREKELHDVGFRLNEIPMSALASTGSPYGIPEKMFKSLARAQISCRTGLTMSPMSLFRPLSFSSLDV
jgi:hypothetical protein